MTATLDVIVPVHDNLAWLHLCLLAVRNFTKNSVRVLVVDNASRAQGSLENMLAEIDRIGDMSTIEVLHRGVNDSFSNSINAGLAWTKANNPAPYTVLLNSDVLVQRGWDEAFVADLSDPNVGLAAARTNAAAGWQGVRHMDYLGAGASLSKQTGMPSNYGMPFAIFCCVAGRREVWDKIGALDGETCPGWGGGEDLDYSWRVIDAGYKIVLSAAYVLHGCSATYADRGVDGAEKARLEAATLERLFKKHGSQRFMAGVKQKPKVMIAIFSRTEQTWRPFAQCLIGAMQVAMSASGGGWEIGITWQTRTMIHLAREEVLRSVLDHEASALTPGAQPYDAVIMLDDDHTFPGDALARLLMANKPVVGALAYRRKGEPSPCVFDGTAKGPVALTGIEHTGLREVDAVGFGMVCIRMDMVRELARQHAVAVAEGVFTDDEGSTAHRPFFRFSQRQGEDFFFCGLVKKHGYKVYCDTELVIGHLADPIVVDEPYAKAWYAGKK